MGKIKMFLQVQIKFQLILILISGVKVMYSDLEKFGFTVAAVLLIQIIEIFRNSFSSTDKVMKAVS